MSECADNSCNAECQWIFARVVIYAQIVGGTRVEWDMHPMFTDVGPYTFQLQVGHTALTDADDWENVGLPVTNTFYAIDDTQRSYGKTQYTHYRIKLTTTEGTYYSRAEPMLGVLSAEDRRRAREILRSWTVRLQKTPAGTEGYLIKRRIYGERCTCLDPDTLDVNNPQHEECYGTGFVDGYYAPVPCVYAELGLKQRRERVDEQMRGSVHEGSVISGKMLAIPHLDSRDIWVNRAADLRYTINTIQSEAEIRGIPLIVTCELRLLPFSDIAYTLPITGQVPS